MAKKVKEKRTTKPCARCGKRKRLDAFCKGKAQFDRASWCKECVAAKKREDRRDPAKRAMVQAQYKRDRNSEARKRWAREDVLSGRAAERSRASTRKYYAKHRDRILAKQRAARRDPQSRHRKKCNALVSLMVYFDMLAKAPCQVCGDENSEAAHRSYDDPLDIFWACPSHHRQYDNGWIDEHGNLLR